MMLRNQPPPIRSKVILVLALGLVGGLPLRAEMTENADAAFSTRDVFRGRKLSGAAFQPGLTVNSGNWAGGLWANLPTASGEPRELDPFLYYYLSQPTVTWQLGLQYYDYAGAAALAATHAYEASLGATAIFPVTPAFPVTANASLAYDPRRQTLSFEASLEHALSLAAIGVPLELTGGGFAGLVDARDLAPDLPGPRARDAYLYGGLRGKAVLTLSSGATLTLGGQWDGAHNAGPFGGSTGNLSASLTLGMAW